MMKYIADPAFSGPVELWPDVGGDGINLSQPVAADRPGVGSVGGRAALTMTSAEEWLFTTDSRLAGLANTASTMDLCITCLIERSGLSGTQTLFGWTNGASAYDEFWVGINSSGDLRIFREAPGPLADTVDSAPCLTATGKPYLITVQFKAGLVDAWINGLQVLSAKPFAAKTPVLAPDRFGVGARDQSTNSQGVEGAIHMLEITQGDPVAIHAAHLAEFLPDEIQDVAVFIGIGQSMVAGATPAPNLIPFACAPGVAYAVDQRPATYGALSGPFKNGNPPSPHFGQSAGWPHMAQRLFDLTGLRSIWSCYAIAGTGLVPETNPVAVNYWSPRVMSKCLAGDYVHTAGGEVLPRKQMIHDVFAAVARNPKFRVSHKAVYMRHGHQDAQAGIANGRITAGDYERELNALFDYMVAEFGIEVFFLDELGREGNDATRVALNEPFYAPIRAAQNAVAASRADTHLVFAGAKEFAPLVVAGNGCHVSGWNLQSDGVHDTSESHRCMGLTWAHAVAPIVAMG